MTPCPIQTSVAHAATETGRLMSSVSVIAPLADGGPLLVIDWCGEDNEDNRAETPPENTPGVTMIEMFTRPDPTVVPLPPMTALETAIVDVAWAHGAWDINRTAVAAGYAGTLPPWYAAIEPQIRARGYVEWRWRPMVMTHELRQRAHGHHDMTLDPMWFGRHGAAPALRMPSIRPGQSANIRLGKGPATAPRKRPRRKPRATDRQLGYIGWLMRRLGDTDPIPSGLTRRSASQVIDGLLARIDQDSTP